MDNISSTAYGSIRRLSRWLGRTYGLQSHMLAPAVLDLVCSNIDSTLATVPEFSDVRGAWERKEVGVCLTTTSPQALLRCVKSLQKERNLSALRFGQWAFVLGDGEADKKRCFSLANEANPPNDTSLADIAFAEYIGAPVRVQGYIGLPAPPASSWLSLDEMQGSPPPLAQFSHHPEPIPVRAYADAWGAQNWADAIKKHLPRRQESPSPLTVLYTAVTSQVSKKADELGIQCEVLKVGPGADAFHIVTHSADKLLRLVIWVQSYFASNGGAFLPWTLGVGSPEYVGDQPSDDEFIKLHKLLEGTSNGDVIATPEFVRRLQRQELRSLVGLPVGPAGEQAVGEAVEIRWWEFPFRSVNR